MSNTVLSVNKNFIGGYHGYVGHRSEALLKASKLGAIHQWGCDEVTESH